MEIKAPKTARGDDEQLSIQFNVFLANRVGQLRELFTLSQQHSLKVLGFSLMDSSEWGVARIIFSEVNKGRLALQSRSIPFTENTVLLVEIGPDTSLAAACQALIQAELSVQFAYSLSANHNSRHVIAIHVDDELMAADVLTAQGFTLLTAAELGD